MTKPRKPSAAVDHTRERADQALQPKSKRNHAFLSSDPIGDLEKLRRKIAREQSDRKNLKPVSAAIETEPSYPAPVEFVSRAEALKKLSEEDVAEAVSRVKQVRATRFREIDRAKKFSSAYKPPRETETERLDRHGDRTRERYVVPFTLPTEISWRIISQSSDKELGITPEPTIKPTRLDHSLEENGRFALAQYLQDRSKELESKKDNGSGLSAWRASPLSPEKQRALDRIDFIHRALSPEDKSDLINFARMVLPIDDRQAKTIHQFGSDIIKYSEKTVAEGAFLGVITRLGSRLSHLFKIMMAAKELHGCVNVPHVQLQNLQNSPLTQSDGSGNPFSRMAKVHPNEETSP
jgi:hypothetical protein